MMKQKIKTTKQALSRPLSDRCFSRRTRAERIRMRKMVTGALWLGSTLGVVIIALYAALTVETWIETTAKDDSEQQEVAAQADDSVTEEDEPLKTPDELSESIFNYVFPWSSLGDLVQELDDSVILNSLDSISVITALALFVLVGRREEERQAHYMAWSMLDAAHDRETSYARYHALQDLNEAGLSLKGLDAPRTDLMQIDLEEADLQQATLDGVKFRKANLRKANLISASLRGAKLTRAVLSESLLFGAKLEEADLSGADLERADLGLADLRQVNFFDANLRCANLEDADLEGANFERTRNLCPSQIKKARNWEKARYDEALYQQLYPTESLRQPATEGC